MPDSTLSRRSAALWVRGRGPQLLPKTHKFHTETAEEPVNCFSIRSTIREKLFEPGAIVLDAEKRIGLILAVTQAVNIVVCAILPNDFRRFSKTLPAAIKMIASTKPGGIPTSSFA